MSPRTHGEHSPVLLRAAFYMEMARSHAACSLQRSAQLRTHAHRWAGQAARANLKKPGSEAR
jgi:hypothetical protein